MKSQSIALVLGALSAITMGMAAEACSSSNAAGGMDGGSSSSSGKGSTSGTGTADTGTTSGSSEAGTFVNDAGTTCYKPPGEIYAEDGGSGPYCPFSESDASGGHNIHCAVGQHCCVPPEDSMMISTCEPGATTCPVAKSVDWVCEGTPDCSGHPGTVCCGQGIVKPQGPQPGCGDGGSTLASFPYVSGFYGSACQASCAVFGDGGMGFQICSKNSECESNNCIAIKPKGNDVGYCGPAIDGGSASSSGSSSSAATSGSSTSGSTTSASSGSGSGTSTTLGSGSESAG